MTSRTWTRREFGQAAMAVAAVAAATTRSVADAAPGLAFVGSTVPGQPDGGAIHVFGTVGDRWIPLTTVPAAAPAHLHVHPTLPVLYTVHAVDTWDHLPRGAVSAYRVHRESGQLTHLHTQPLSLSATYPRHAVLTADASHLFVAAEGGGIYNLLPVAADGTLRPASAIHKEFGSERDGIARSASPNSVALLPDGSMLAADAGLEALTTFTVDDGLLTPRHRARVHRGEGPTQLTLSQDGRFAYTVGAGSGQVLRHRLVNGGPRDETSLGRQTASPLVPALLYVPHAISFLQV